MVLGRPVWSPTDSTIFGLSIFEPYPYLFKIVDFSIVTQPQIRELLHPDRLHAIQLVNNRKAVETKTAVGESIDILKTKCIRTSMSYLHGTQTLYRKAFIASKQGPDATHCEAAELPRNGKHIQSEHRIT